MGARLPTLAVRLILLVAIWLLGTATFTLAQDGGSTSPVQGDEAVVTDDSAAPTDALAEAGGPLVVPDVLELPYVFAKGVLEDAGFAWKVKGKVKGYAANLVVEQSVAPETEVLDTGLPTIVLRLATNPAYEERGIPDNASPYKGTPLVLEDGGEPIPAQAQVPAAETTEAGPSTDDESAQDAATESSYPETPPE